jgi:hypothetical protein
MMSSEKDRQGYMIIAALAVAVIGIFAVKVSVGHKPKPGADNCAGDVQANTVILLDQSEAVPTQTVEETTSRVMSTVDHAGVNERVTVFNVSDDSTTFLTPVVSLCKPPTDGNRLYENVAMMRKDFEQKFEKPIREVVSRPPSESNHSPIAQAITDLALSKYLRGSTNRLLIFSDMLENTPRFSMYHCGADPVAAYRESRRGAMERPHFKNTTIAVNLIPRTGLSRETIACRDRIWPWFFSDNEGPVPSLVIDYLPGGPPVPAKGH